MQTEATEHLDLLESMQRVLCYGEAIHVHALGKGSGKNAVMYDYQNKYSGRFQLLKQ